MPKKAKKEPATPLPPVEIQGIASFRFLINKDAGIWVAPTKILAAFFNQPLRVFKKQMPFIHDWVNNDYQMLLAQLLKGLKPRKYVEFDCPLKGKPARWIKIRAKAELKGKALLFSGFFIDITQQKKNEVSIRDNQLKLAHLLANSQEAVVIRDKDLKMIYANQASRQLLGYSALDEMETNFHDNNHPDDWEELNAIVAEAMNHPGVPIKTSFRKIHKSGHEVWVEGSITNLLYEPTVQAIVSNFRDISERKRAERALVQERQLFIDGPTVVFSWKNQPGWPVEYVSPNIKTQFGFDAEDLISGRIPYADIVHPDDLARVAGEVKAYSESGAHFFEQEYRLKHRLKGWRWIYDFTIVTRNAAGEITHYQGTVLDRTDQKLAEETIKKERALADSVINNLPGMFWIYTREGYIIRWNENLAVITGYSSDELTRMKSWDLFHPSQANHIKQRVEMAFDMVLPGIERTLLTSKGIEIPVFIQGWAIQYENRQCIMSIAVDISEQKKSEKALQRSQTRYRDLYNNVPSMYFTLNEGGIILAVNQYGCDHLGYPEAEMLGRHVSMLFHPDDVPIGARSFEIALREEGSMQWELRKIKKDGQIIWVTEQARIQYEDDGKRIVLIACNDITERKMTESKLRESEQRYRNLFNQSPVLIATHDLNGKFLTINARAPQAFGFDSSQVIGRSLVDFMDPAERKNFYENYLNPVIKNGHHSGIYRVLNARGNKVYLFYNCYKWLDENGAPYIIGFAQDITALKIAERSLRDSEYFLSESQRVAGVGSYHFDISKDKWRSSRVLNEILGIEEGIEKNFRLWLQLIHPEERAEMLTYFQGEVLEQRKPFNKEYRIIRPSDGQERWVWGQGKLILSEEGVPIGVRGVIQDITDRKQAELSLREVDRRLALTTNAVGIGVWDWDIETGERFWDDQCLFLFGITRDDLAKNNSIWIDLLHPEDRNSALQVEVQALASVNSFKSQYRIVHKDGQVRFIQDFAQILRNEGGKAVKMVGVSWDVTDSKMMEESLREEEIRFRVMADAAPVLIWMTDSKGKMVYVNQKWLDFTGRPQEQELDFGWKSVIHEGDAALIPICPADINLRQPFSFAFRMLRHDGQYRWMVTSAEPRKPSQGGFLGYIGTCTDITDQKEKDEKLFEANKKIGELQLVALRSAMNPHFIFNALNSVQYFITQNDRANALSYLSKFSKLVRGILNSSVTKTIRLSSELELLRYYIEIEQTRFENRFDYKIQVGREVDAETIEIPSLLIQPFVENAILHGLYNKEDRGYLVVDISVGEQCLTIVIEDNGVGRAEAERIKEKNFPAHKSIGLKITADRLQLHNSMLLEPPVITDLFENGASAGTRVRINVRI